MTTIEAPPAPRIYAVRENISPEAAREYLATTNRNRPVKPAFVKKLAGAMERGEWVFNGETIKFDADGHLIDGQHRLHACIMADTTIDTLVVRNAVEEAQDTIDTGTRRTLSDALKLRGEKNAHVLSAAIAWLHRLQNISPKQWGGGQAYPTIHQGLRLLEANPGMRDAIQVGQRVYSGAKVPPGLSTALYYHLSSIDEQDAAVFFEHTATGAGLDEGHPILVLRETCDRYANQRPKPNHTYFAAVVVKAWNAFKEGRSVQRLSWSPGGSRQESFPSIRAY